MAGTTNRSTETELKLGFAPVAERALAEHAVFRPPGSSPPEKRHIVTTYFDTPNDALKGRGLSLRIRRVGGERIQTVKSESPDRLAATRGEWEWPLKREWPDLSLVAQTPVADRLPPSFAEQLRPIIVTDVVRTVRTVHLENDTVIEAAFDRGSIIVGDAKEPIRELELELRKGEAGPLYRLALDLHATAPLTVGIESKPVRGYHLKSGVAPQAKRAVAPDFDPAVSAAAAFRRIVVSELNCLIANEPAAKARDAEGIHQMRVGIRRLRSALILFAPYLEPQVADAYHTELKRTGQIFGEARDWDVFCLEALPHALDRTENAGWVELLWAAASARRDRAHTDFIRALDAPAFNGLVLGMAAWAEDGGIGDAALRRPLSRLAPELLDRLQDKVDRRGRNIEDRSDKELHALRKGLKKLRYGVEYMAPLYPGKALNAFLKRCRAVQKTLGVINDAATATRRAHQLTEGRTDLAAAAGAVAQSSQRPWRKAAKTLGKEWAAFHGEGRFWS
jgi:triphosphatase